MDVNAIVQSASVALLAVAWKVAGAVALWLVGRWLISFSLGLLGRAFEKQRFDDTLTRYAQTGLRIRNLDSGEDRWLKYPIQRDDMESGGSRDLLPGYAFTPDGREVVVTFDGKINRVRVDNGESREVPFDPAEGGPWEIEANFIAAVRAGRPSATPSFWDGLKYMELTEAISRSADEGRTVELPFDPDPPKPPAE